MRLTVLGSSASYAGPGQACAGHLIEGAGARVLLDCGNGVLANLAKVTDPATLDAVFITHLHPDHFADLFALQALIRFAPAGPVAPLPLHGPAGLLDAMTCLLSGHGAVELGKAFVFHELADGMTLQVGELAVTPVAVDHSVETFALVVESEHARLCYTSDTKPGAAVLLAAQSADLLLAEATLPEEYAGRAPHLTARQAGGLAREAGAGALVLTHIWPTNDRERMVAEATTAFGGPVRAAAELETYDIGRPRT